MDALSEIVGDSRDIAHLRAEVQQILRSVSGVRRPPPILICGETGTGKGLLTRLLHRAGPRAQGPFVDVNCAAIPDQLLEAELFGFERGAFTDARQAKPGLFQLAHRGTLFLDEIGLLPEGLQAKLLKVLEDGAVRRLGGRQLEPVDVWIIAATSTNLAEAMRARRFREDLYHRLAVLTLDLPPLRTRGADVLLLAERFLARICEDYGLPARALAPDARAALCAHAWPGNVRELTNLVERAVLLTDEATLTAAHLGLPLSGTRTGPGPGPLPAPIRPRSPEQRKREQLLDALAETGWNISRTATMLGIARNTVTARIARFGLTRGGAVETARVDAPAPAPAPAAAVIVAPAAIPGPAPAEEAPAPTRIRWESRHVALLHVDLEAPEGAESPPEAARALATVLDKVASFGGRVEELGPASLIAAFGVDPAEDAAARAVLAALAAHRLAEAPDPGEARTPGLRAAVHAATIPVSRAGDRSFLDLAAKREALGALLGLAPAATRGTVIASEAAARLLRRRFQLGPTPSAAAAGLTVWRVLGFEATRFRSAGGMAAFVGRRDELRLLQARLALAAGGRGQVVGIAGEPGIGKSRLLWEFRQALAGDDVAYVEGQCASYGVTAPLRPVAELVRAICGATDTDAPDTIRERVGRSLEALGLDLGLGPFLLHLLEGDRGEPLAGLAPEAVSARMVDAVLQVSHATSRRRPLVMAVEDLHWIDGASEACLTTLAERLAGARILLVVTYRPGVRLAFLDRSYATQIALPPLSTEDCAGIARAVLGGVADDAVARAIAARANGNPLFVEELTLAMAEGSATADTALPPTLQGLLATRLDRLGPPRAAAEVAAVIGESFSLSMLEAVADPDAAPSRADVQALVEAEIVVPDPGAAADYRFRHALIREAAYRGLTPAARQALHARAARALEERFPDVAAAHPELVAHHLTEAGRERAAIGWWVRAGTRARQQAAYADAIAQLERAQGLLGAVPEGPERDRLELEIQVSLGISLQATRGFAAPEVGALHARGRELCRRVEGGPLLLGALGGLFLYYLYRTDLATAREMAEQHRAVTQEIGALNRLCASHSALGLVAFQEGALAEARAELARSIELADTYARPEGTALTPNNIAVASESALAMTLAVGGELDGALAASLRAVERAERCPPSERAFSLGYAETAAARVRLLRAEPHLARPHAQRAVEIGRANGFGLHVAAGLIADAAARVLAGEATATDELGAALAAWRARGLELDVPYWLAVVAHGHRAAGRQKEAEAAVTEGLARPAGGGRVFEAELLRLRGELAAGTAPAAAAADLEAALAMARAQGARLFELRAATSLHRLGPLPLAGTPPLAAVVAAFREGRDTADVREALALLDGAVAGGPARGAP